MDLTNKKAAFLGDSITRGFGASDNEHIYHQLIKKEYKLNEAYNLGVFGSRIARQYARSENEEFDETFLERAKRIPDDVDMVIVFGGTNDYGHGDAPLGQFSDRTEYTFYGACHLLMKYLSERFVGKPVIFMTPLHRTGEDGKRVNGIKTEHTLRDYVGIIKETAEYYSMPVLDLFGESGMQPNIESHNNYFFTDGLHLNDNGHERVANLLGKYLERF